MALVENGLKGQLIIGFGGSSLSEVWLRACLEEPVLGDGGQEH